MLLAEMAEDEYIDIAFIVFNETIW